MDLLRMAGTTTTRVQFFCESHRLSASARGQTFVVELAGSRIRSAGCCSPGHRPKADGQGRGRGRITCSAGSARETPVGGLDAGRPVPRGQARKRSGGPTTRITTHGDRSHILSGPHGATLESPRAARPPPRGSRNTRKRLVGPETHVHARREAGEHLGAVFSLLERPRPPVASDSRRKSAKSAGARTAGRLDDSATRSPRGAPAALIARQSRMRPTRRRPRPWRSGGRCRCLRPSCRTLPSRPCYAQSRPRGGVRVSRRSTRGANRT